MNSKAIPASESAEDGVQSPLSREQKIELLRALAALSAERSRPRPPVGTLGALPAAFRSFSLFPQRSARAWFDEAGVHATAKDALAADWRRVGRDMWSGLLAELNQRRSVST